VARDVFVSHASEDHALANRLAVFLEACGIACFLAPRDIPAGAVWDEAVVDGIDHSAGMVLVLSTRANASSFVKNEINRAFSKNKPLFAFRTEEVALGKSLELYLARHQWIDGFPGPVEEKFSRLAEAIGQWLGRPVGEPARALASGGVTMTANRCILLRPALAVLKRALGHAPLAWAVAGVSLVVSAIALVSVVIPAATVYQRAPSPQQSPTIRFFVPLPAGVTLISGANVTHAAISPDGRRVVFVANRGGIQQLWLRSLDSLDEAHPLVGTDGATQPFWSPDSRTIAFTQGVSYRLRTIDANGGPVQTVCDSPLNIKGGTWNRDSTIVYGNLVGGLFKVAASGGQPGHITTPDARHGEGSHRFPSFLPDGRHFLYLAFPSNTIWMGSLDEADAKLLVRSDSQAQYVAPGYLLFARQGTLMAQPFDAVRATLTGDAVPIAQQLMTDPSGGVAFSASDVSSLVIRTGTSSPMTQLKWVDRTGKSLGNVGHPGPYRNPELSPDGTRVAVEASDPQSRTQDIWTIDVTSGMPSRLTFDPHNDISPVWSPDGSRIAFSSDRQTGEFNVYAKPSNGSALEEVLLTSSAESLAMPFDWSPDGSFILYRLYAPVPNLAILPLVGDRKPHIFQHVPFNMANGKVASNGRWVAYHAVESGRYEVYVQSFPTPGAKWQLSRDGGFFPRWRKDGKELFYYAPNGQLMAVPIKGEAALEVGAPVPLFRPGLLNGPNNATGFRAQYDVTRDGQRFLLNVPVEDAPTPPITVVLDWTVGLKK
jgi:Tol biopolymer transport system component